MDWLLPDLSLLQCAGNSSDDFCFDLRYPKDRVALFLLQTGDLANEYQSTKMWEWHLSAVFLAEGRCSFSLDGD